MSQKSRRWVKIWHEILTDQTFQDLPLEQQARYYNLLVYTSCHGDNGVLKIAPPARILLHLLQCENYDIMCALIEKLPNVMRCKNDNAEISVTFPNWSKYQIDSTSYERVKRKRKVDSVTPQEKEKEKEEDKEKDKDIVKRGKPADPRTKQFIDYAFKTFQNSYGESLCVDGGKDGAIVKNLLGTYGLDRLKGLWDEFMLSTDPFIEQAGRSIGVFKTQINKILSSSRGKPPTDYEQGLEVLKKFASEDKDKKGLRE